MAMNIDEHVDHHCYNRKF